MESTRAVDRALDILECFNDDNLEMGITDVAKQTGLSKATAFRIMHTLKQRGYLTFDETNEKFRLGPKVIKLGKLFLANLDYRAVARPFMQQLRDNLNESVSLYISRNGQRICVERVESTHPLRRVVNIGDELPLNRGAAGKILLAFGAIEPNPLDKQETNKILRQGYVISHGEREQGVSSVAAPIFDHNGNLLAALAISGPSIRFTDEQLAVYVPAVVRTAHRISHCLGY